MLFWASFLALMAAGVGFVFRVMIPDLWADSFQITTAQVGALTGAALWPIAVSMILFSLIVDKIGYRVSMFCAFALQALSVLLTISASSYDAMWWACICAGLGHGVVEAVINPLCATMYKKDKSKMLNILHASWPAGIVFGGICYILLIGTGDELVWANTSWIFYLMLLPILFYGIMFVMCRKYPVDERIENNVSYVDMLREFGGLGIFLASTFLIYEITGQLGIDFGDINKLVACLAIGAAIGLITGFLLKSGGKILFFILCIIMNPLATAELATDGWIQSLMKPIMGAENAAWAIVFSAAIMMVLRFFAGVPLKYMSPPALLLLSSVFSIVGLYALSSVPAGPMIFGAFVLYAVGQTFYWPTVLGFTSEQFPKGGAMTLNTVSAMGLLTVGIFGFPFLGAVQTHYKTDALKTTETALVQSVIDNNEYVILTELIKVMCAVARDAGAAILQVYGDEDFGVQTKSDNSPLTRADLAAHNIIVEGLQKRAPGIPVLSEESDGISFAERSSWDQYFLVDPLDGTKEFINRNGEFTVNIALIEKGVPMRGVVFVPVKDVMYTGDQHEGLATVTREGETGSIQVRKLDRASLTVVASRRHGGEALEACLSVLRENFSSIDTTNMGSSLKLCLIAEGEADLYPRLAPTSEWDTAAAQAVVEAAGGKVVDVELKELRYNTKDNILNPFFYVIGDTEFDWNGVLSQVVVLPE
jgi:3'(2'),5'-bisphosphate nucleotidase